MNLLDKVKEKYEERKRLKQIEKDAYQKTLPMAKAEESKLKSEKAIAKEEEAYRAGTRKAMTEAKEGSQPTRLARSAGRFAINTTEKIAKETYHSAQTNLPKNLPKIARGLNQEPHHRGEFRVKRKKERTWGYQKEDRPSWGFNARPGFTGAAFGRSQLSIAKHKPKNKLKVKAVILKIR